ncbi:hypothetical protein ACQI5H_09215 [Mycobacterium heidelbergense]|uniref:hypothetical protein n=1 Tax=Mycobacterium heidelbergense TaxID=53376 RepID=UPI003CEFE23C
MFLRKYEQRFEPQLSSALGEPILRCIALNAATMSDRMSADSLAPWWRPSLMVNGQPHTRLPQTMFLILTPTRVLITDTKRGMTGYRPVLDSPILTLLRGDAEVTAIRDDDGLWLYRLKSRAQSAELDLELASGGRGIAAELAGQLQEFSVTQHPANATAGLTAPPESIAASQMLDARRRRLTKSYRIASLAGAVLSVLFLGFGTYEVYAHNFGTPTKATIVSCGRGSEDTCHGTWILDGRTHTGRIWGDVDGLAAGSSLDVRVLNGWAFAPRFPKWEFIWGAIFAVAAVWPSWPKRRRTGHAGPAQRGRHAGP